MILSSLCTSIRNKCKKNKHTSKEEVCSSQNHIQMYFFYDDEGKYKVIQWMSDSFHMKMKLFWINCLVYKC